MSLLLALSLVAPTSLAQSPSSPRDETVRVRIETDAPEVSLFRVTSEGYGTVATTGGTGTVGIVHYQRECTMPCDVTLRDPTTDFFIAGSGITPSRRFTLLDHGRDVSLKVDPGSSGLRTTGWLATIFGVSLAVAGGVAMALDGTVSSDSSLPKDNTLRKMGMGSLIGGGALVAIGLPLFIFNGTDVKLAPNKLTGNRGFDL
ncbi:hypothetical protein [Myxococcus virescens]|uniref:PEGA domain-containing protein n=1 Tax=Myxococcus virescens TaxID=83456 RepID=A0A511HPT4_9BACT|nr:hypothetical protein [Myxococcus virescens]GEL75598.1 hypothetical protein MVI01_73820 [Myxococcus virescens]SDF37699.1 hypothetical protein SAMN04488504_1402 [Myxococcus virescens]